MATRRTKPPKPAVPPPDDPLRRHEETDVDRLLLTYTPDTGVTSAAAASDALAPAAPRRRGIAPSTRTRGAQPQRTVMSQLAARRVAAVADARGGGGTAFGTNLPPGILGVAPVPGASNWVQLGPVAIPNGQTYGGARVLVTGRITSIAIDPTNPDVIYIGAAQGGVWKTTTGGTSWTPMSDNELSLAIGALALDPVDPQIIYAGTGEGNFSGDSYYGNGVLKSTNGGASWTINETSLFMGARFCRIAIAPDATSRLFAATTVGLCRSTNGGVNWTQMSGGGLPAVNCTDVVIDRNNSSTVLAAFWGGGIWKTTNAHVATPTWTKLAGGLPASGFSRIALGISRTSSNVIYALMAADDWPNYTINQLFRSSDSGATWTAVPLPFGSIGSAGFYNLYVSVDRFTPDVIYLGAVSLWSGVRNAATNTWTITNIGQMIHPDNHALAQHPTDRSVIYAGNDGGIYRTNDGGATWSDAINKDLSITQFEFIAQHPASDAVILAGTQDNGTEQFRTDPVFYHSDDGDGGYTCIEQSPSPTNVLSTYYGATPKRSELAGKFGTWSSVTSGLDATNTLFYPPMVMDRTNSQNIALGTNSLNVTTSQGTMGWTPIAIPGFTGSLSALDYPDSSLIYAGAKTGEVFCFRNVSSMWNATAIHALPLPGAFINDIAAVPGSPNSVIVVFGGFGIPHVWRGDVPPAGSATWTSISNGLPDIPVNALVIDPASPATLYIATDVAVYRSTDGGASWTQFSQGLPNCAVFDLQLHSPTRLLRAATHGRGMWEKKLDVPSLPAADLYFRDHAMSTARIIPAPNGVPAAYEDLRQFVSLGAPQYSWMSADMKVDALAGSGPTYQYPVADVNYVVYEAWLQHRNPIRGQVNRAYVQLHNRGFEPAQNVTVKLLWADAAAGLPLLPADFWTAFPNNSADTSAWHPIGAAKVVAAVSNTLPTILEWDFTPPPGTSAHVCLLAIMDSPSDPIPNASKGLNVTALVANEKHAALKNLVVVDPKVTKLEWVTVDFHAATAGKNATIRLIATGAAMQFAVALPKTKPTSSGKKPSRRRSASMKGPAIDGLKPKKATAKQVARLKEVLRESFASYDPESILFGERSGATITGLPLPKGGVRAAFLVTAPQSGEPATLTIVQEEDGQVVGGITIVVADPDTFGH